MTLSFFRGNVRLVGELYERNVDMTRNMTRKTEVRDVSFESHGAKLAGRLYLPSLPDGQRPPVIIVMGSWMTVKEQMPANYAPLLAEAGSAALTFDFRGFGKSEGSPREVESAQRKAEDIRAAVAFLRQNDQVDGQRVGVLPICASSMYTVMAAQQEPGIKSVAMVAPWIHNSEIVLRIYGGESGVAQRLELARAARQAFENDGTVQYVKAASNSDPSAAMYWEGDVLDYYLNPKRGAIPEWGARFALMAWQEWLELDSVAMAARHTVPTRLVIGKGIATPDGAERFAAGMKGPHDLVYIDGTQFDFYDQPASVRPAAAAALEHFQKTL